VSIKPLSPEAIETFSLVLHPKRHYVSSSLGHTGSVKIFSNPSAREKDAFVGSSFVDSTNDETSFESILRAIQLSARDGASNLSSPIQLYMDRVNNAPTSAKNSADIEILRYTPTTAHTVNTEKKKFVVERLMPFYRAHRSNNNWAYPNYHSVNFFTASSVPSNAAWLYPNVVTADHPNGCYSPSGSFTFELMLNPRYSVDAPGNDFKAGTILHLSSSYALSLVTGSARGADGKPNGFRLLLQLSSSADIAPSLVTPGSGTGKFAFQSDDNSLLFNKWQHVLITWGTSTSDAGTGSFYVDGVRRGTFTYPSASILTTGAASDPDVLCIGNFYEGSNSGTAAQIRFFANQTANREGLYELDATTNINYPSNFSFKHQLNAEFHDLSIREEYVIPSKARILGLTSPHYAPTKINNYLFYLPPFFVPGTPYLTVVNGDGGVLFSPFDSNDGANENPFSAPMSFGVAGKYNSLENFTRDFATNRHARVLYLTTSVIQNTTADARTANEILYATSSVALRNLNILPCDDGNFRPNFQLASNLDLKNNPRFVDDLGSPEDSLISLRNMVSGSIYSTLFTGSNGAGTGIAASGEIPSNLLAVYQRTQDPSSNEVVFFDLSNLFYGQRIKPGSFVISDSNLTGSNSKVKVTLTDDGNGGLYRSDCETTKASWNHVGNIFYEEGIVAIKSPALPFYGKNGFDITFEGEKSVHVSKLNVIVDATSYNTSSNLTWNTSLSASFDTNRDAENQKYVTITGINFHDVDLNVVMRAQLAQPIVKRKGDRFLIKVRYDY
jgi:hypothetical protein